MSDLSQTAHGAPPPPVGPPAAAHRKRVQVNLLLAAALVIGILAVLAVWINRQVLNTDNWTKTSSQLLADPTIDATLGSLLVNELFRAVDVASELERVLPSEVSGLASPAAAGLRQLADQVAPKLLESSAVQEAWRTANRTAHRQLVQILEGGGTTVSTENGVVTLKLHALLTQLADQVGLGKQLSQARAKLQGSAGQTARETVKRKLGVTLPAESGNVVLLRSSQLKLAQNVVKSIKGLAIVLPLITLVLFILAVWLAVDWRRLALRRTGWCLVAIGLLVLLVRRVIGDALVDSVVKVAANKPAVHNAFAIGTSLLYDIAIAMISYGLLIVIAAWLGGPTRPARALQRVMTPTLRDYPGRAYAAAAVALLLVVIWGPFPSTRQPIAIAGIAVLLIVGIRALTTISKHEFPDAMAGETTRRISGWYASRRQRFSGRDRQAQDSGSWMNDLERLAALRDGGQLTDEEYREQKALILRRS